MIRPLLLWLTARLPVREIRGDDGQPYLERYYIASLAGWGIYLHRFVASDPDRGLHDHPWGWSASLILAGGYFEYRQRGLGYPLERRVIAAPALNIIRGNTLHHLQIPNGGETWSLFIHSQRIKRWGFLRASSTLVNDGIADLIWSPWQYDTGDDSAGTWWKTCPTGRELRARR